MKKNKIIIFCLIIILTKIVYAQTAQQQQELNKIKSDIGLAYRQIAHDYAYIQVYDFFKSRFNYVHQANFRCLNLFEKTIKLSEKLSKPNLFNQVYDSPEKAYAALETLTTLAIQDNIIVNEIEDLQNEYKLQKEKLKETEHFVSLTDDAIFNLFPRPADLNQDYGYKENLLKAYHEVISQSGEKFKYYISKCVDSNWDVNDAVQKRKFLFNGFAEKLADYYVENNTDKYIHQLKELSKPSSEINILLNIESVLNRLDTQYRDAALYERDYLKSISLINAYESITSVILARIVPLSTEKEMRNQAQIEIQRRIQKAKEFKDILNREKPSIWLQKRFDLISQNIKNGKVQCNGGCKNILLQVPDLISASKIIEDVSNNNIYIILGNQALDKVVK